ncbi:MAG TPA: hypothetical protein VGS27_00700 [Candidatus Sulfotelmatobacter sp.]|nr:hypothetical protein [Candidatus Sulfotelmatobacter sp.]
MSFSNRIILPVIVSALGMLAACGGGNTGVTNPTPPPSGGFSNSNLKGTYVFSITGADSSSGFLTVAGTFVANGSGGITGGSIDMNDPNFSGPLTNSAVSGGQYTISADGRGQASLTTATPFSTPLQVDFVLSSSNSGLITEFDNNGSGSGTLDLQTSTAQPTAGTYVFGLSGISGFNAATGGGIPAGAVGAITLDASGTATGSYDYNNNGTPSLLTLNSGTVTAGSPGTATLATSSGTLNFDVYSIDGSHMKMIEVDSTGLILAGDLFSQTSASFPSGQMVFTMAGYDSGLAAPLAVGGYMTSDGTSAITAGVEDFNDGGTSDSTPISFTGALSAANGRYQVQFNNFENGGNGANGTYTFAAYPSSGGIEMIEIDGNGVTSGVAFAQSSTALAASQGYGMNVSAENQNLGLEEDDIAEFTTTNSSFSGVVDVNDEGQQVVPNQRFTGTYSPDTPPTGRGIFNSSNFGGVYYTVDNADALFLELDQTQLGLGTLEGQNASAKSSLTASHFAMLRLKPGAKGAWRHHGVSK